MDQVAQVFLLLGKQIKGERLAGVGGGLQGKNGEQGSLKGGAPAPHLPAPLTSPCSSMLGLQLVKSSQSSSVSSFSSHVRLSQSSSKSKVSRLGGDKEGGTEREPGSRGAGQEGDRVLSQWVCSPRDRGGGKGDVRLIHGVDSV